MNEPNDHYASEIEGFRILPVHQRSGRKLKKKKRGKPKHIRLIDVVCVLSFLILIACEVEFPLADREFTEQPSTLVVDLAILGGRSQEAMDKFDSSLAEFMKISSGHPRDIGEAGVDIDQIFTQEVRYMSYYQAAGMILVDELNQVKLLDTHTAKWEKEEEGKQIIGAFEKIRLLQPKLDQCIQSVRSDKQKIEESLSTGPTDKTRFELTVSTARAVGDFLRGKNAHWLQCRNDLEDYDRQLVRITGNYSFILERLEERATFEKYLRLGLKLIATFALAICGATYRTKWIKAASETLGG